MLYVLRNSGRLVAAMAVVLAMSLAGAAGAADTGTISGKVTKDGTGVAGAKVVVVVPNAGKKPTAAPNGERPKPVAQGTTEADGSFKLSDVPAGDYSIRAGAKGQGMAHQKVTVKAGENTEVNLALTAGKGGKGGKKKEAK